MCSLTLPSVTIPSEIAACTRQKDGSTSKGSPFPANRLQHSTSGMAALMATDSAVMGHNRQFLAAFERRQHSCSLPAQHRSLQCTASDSKRGSTALAAFSRDQNLTPSSVEPCALLQRWASEAPFQSASVNSVTATVATLQTSNLQATTQIPSDAATKAVPPNASKADDDNYSIGVFCHLRLYICLLYLVQSGAGTCRLNLSLLTFVPCRRQLQCSTFQKA